jgi:hypothetical protein
MISMIKMLGSLVMCQELACRLPFLRYEQSMANQSLYLNPTSYAKSVISVTILYSRRVQYY